MKQKIRIIDNTGRKPKVVIEKEVKMRDLDHFASQLKYRATVTRNKKIYTRKKKHKNRGDDYDSE